MLPKIVCRSRLMVITATLVVAITSSHEANSAEPCFPTSQSTQADPVCRLRDDMYVLLDLRRRTRILIWANVLSGGGNEADLRMVSAAYEAQTSKIVGSKESSENNFII